MNNTNEPKGRGRRSNKKGTLTNADLERLDSMPATDINGIKTLLGSVLAQAVEDITYGHRDAVTFLESSVAAHYADLVGVNPVAMAEHARKLAAQHQPQAWSRYNQRHLRVAFDAYANGEMSLAEIARRFTIRQETLRTLWAQMGLVYTNTPHYQAALKKYNDWRASGLSMKQYEVVNKLSPGNMHHHCRKWGFDTSRRKPATVMQLQQQYDAWRASGLSLNAFELQNGMTGNTLGKRFRRAGLSTSRVD